MVNLRGWGRSRIRAGDVLSVQTPPFPRPLRKVNMLKYIGKGFIPGIPARDLADEEVKKYGGAKLLLSTGLFEKPKKKKVVKIIEEGEKWQDQELSDDFS
ncbi:MAG: hypothetical protein ACYSUV_10310 [Planctomycetota bacterium]